AIKVEAEKGFTFCKFKNPYASVKVNGIEIEDDKALTGVPVGEGIKVEISGKNAEISDIYYTFNPRTDAKISSKDDMDSALAAGKASKASGKSIELSKSDLEKITAQAANEYVIYVRTDREEDPDAYSGKITAVTAKAGSVNVTKNGLTLYAGGDKLENPAAYDGEVTLETSFSRKDGMPVETSGKSNTIYALTSTGAKAAASFGKEDNYNKLTTNSVANKVDGLDTITVNESVADSSWLDMLNYTSIADLTVKPLNSFYDHYAFVYSFANSGSAALVDNAIRSYKASNSKIFNDNVTVKINCYKSDKSDEEGIEITKASLGDKKLLSAIGYESNPSYSESELTPELKMKKLNEGEASEDATKRVISEVVNAGTINIASDLKFADGSTLALTSEILAIPQTYGYFAIPGIKTDNSTVYGSQASSIALGLADSAYKSAAVEYRVFEALKDGYDHSGLISEEAIEEAVNVGDIKEVTDKAVFVEVNSSNSSSGDAVNGGYITSAVSGNLYTLTAKKIINGEAKNFTAVGSVDTAPVKADPLAVTVEENITSFKVIMDLTDEAGKNLPDATDAKYQFPQVSSSQTAGKELLALAHSDIESGVGTKKTKGYVFDNVKKGQIFKLPDITAFDEASINPKRTLAGWKVNNSSYYKVNSEIIITKDTEVTPVWAYKYSSVAGKQADGNGKVTVYIDEANAPAEATETIAKGKSINLSTCAYVIDLNEAPINESGLKLTYSEELKTLSGATSAVLEDKDDKSLTVSGSKITGADKSSGSALSYTYTEGSYSYKDRADGGDLTLETTNFLVEEEEKWKLEMDPVTVEEGMTSFYDLCFYKDGKKADETAYTREDALDFNNASIKNIISSIKTGGEEYADVFAYDPTAAHHKLAISGLKGGKSATLQLTVVTDQNTTYNIEAAITVTAAKRGLYIKSIGAVNVSDEENNIILIPVVSKETALDIVFAYKGNEASSEDAERWAFDKITPTDPNEQMIDVVKSFTKKASTSTAVLTEKADLFGIGHVKVSYTLDNGEVFTKLFDVKTYYPVVFGGSGTTSGDNKAYTVKKDTKILSANSTEKLIYDGKTSHTIEDAAKYTASLNTADDSLVFLGWSAGEAISTAQSASYPAGKAITFNEESTDWPFNELDSVTLNPQFGPIPVESITGYDKEIRITDEAVGASYGEKSTSAKALTDYVVENITAKPGNSGSDVTVSAYDAGMFTIVDASTPDRRDDENNENYWNSSSISISGLNKKGAVKLTMTGDSGKTLRSGAFTLAKVEGKVGVSEIHIISGDLDYAIPVYVNGAYNDSNVSPSVERYMVDGKNLEEGVKIVKGEKRFYKDYALVKNGVVFITVDEKEKLVFIVNDKQLTTVGVSAYDGDNYYIGKDGYVKYDGLFSGEGSADTGKKYFAYGDGTLEVGELREIEGVTYYFNSKCEMAVASSTANAYELDSVDKKYYVNAAGKVAIKELFTVDGKQYLANEEGVKVTYAMTKAAGTEGKFTVNNIEYEIAEDDTAKEIDRFYVKSSSYSFPDSFTVNKASEELANTKASFVKVSQKTGESIEVKDVTPDITFNPYDTLKWTAGSTVKVTATVDGNGYYESDYKTLRTSPIIEASEEYVISEDGKTAVLADKRYYLAGSIKWSAWPESFKTADGDPKISATVTIVSDKKGTMTGQDAVVSLSSNSTGRGENHVIYTATADLSKYYKDATYTDKAKNETSSETYIVKDGLATRADKKLVTKVSAFNWTPASNKEYNKDSVVSASITVSYRLEKAGTSGSDTIQAKVVYDPLSTDTKKIYKATVNPTGYYKADGTAYDWTKVTGENIYAVSGGGEGLSEGIIIEDLGEEYFYTGTAIKPLVTVTDISSDEVLVPGKDYTVKYQNNTKAGTASLIITGKGNYDRQTVTKNFNIINPMEGEDLSNYYEVKSVKIEKEANPITYDGTAKAPSKLTIATKEGATLTANWDGSDYDIEELDGGKTVKIVVENNINKGSGTIAVYGSKKDKPVKKNFSIKAADMNALDDRITVEAGAVSYSKKGAKAAVVVNFVNGDGDTVELLEGRDYTVKYGYTNKKNAGEKAGTVTITGKNNFTKKAKTIAGFDIEKLSLSDENVIVDAYEKLAPKSLKVKVFDFEGEEVNNKSYSITKITKGDEDITNSKEKLAIGDDISVTVKGDGVNIEAAELTLDLKIGTKLSSAKFNAKALTKTYEGAPIYLEDSDLENVTATVKINKADAKLVAGENYEVVSYKNNNNKGNMTVYVRGTGEKVSGYGKFTVKVNAKELKEAK
ncbi:MAG: hypothetical protein K5931_02820, partial [Lachnospiraceae bacterium]|nr:hypothetical protein [Lachnospiraceae bacterium]